MHGKTGAYVGAGSGSGFGLKVTPDELHLGQIQSEATTFKNPPFERKNELFIKKNLAQLTIGATQLTQNTNSAELRAGSDHGIEITKGGNVTIKTKAKVLIG